MGGRGVVGRAGGGAWSAGAGGGLPGLTETRVMRRKHWG